MLTVLIATFSVTILPMLLLGLVNYSRKPQQEIFNSVELGNRFKEDSTVEPVVVGFEV